MKDINKEIEKTLKEFEEKFGGVMKWENYNDPLTHENTKDMTKEVWQFIQTKLNEVREEAVRGFAEYLMRDEHGKPIREIPSYHYTALIDLAETYLTTKEGKDD